MSHNRPAFLLAAGAIILVMLVSIGAFLLLLNDFVDKIAPTIPDVMTDVPTLYYYDVNGTKIIDFGDIRSEVEVELQLLYDELEALLASYVFTSQLTHTLQSRLKDYNPSSSMS